MFRFIFIFTIILACTQDSLGSNLIGASQYAPITSIISGRYGHGSLANSVHLSNHAVPAASIISSYSSEIVHPNSAILHQTLSNSIPSIGHQQYISSPLTSHQIYSSPTVVSGGLYGHNGLHSNSYGIQRSYTVPVAAASGYSSHGLYSAPAYGVPFTKSYGGINGHL